MLADRVLKVGMERTRFCMEGTRFCRTLDSRAVYELRSE